jgi:hypothetical protein
VQVGRGPTLEDRAPIALGSRGDASHLLARHDRHVRSVRGVGGARLPPAPGGPSPRRCVARRVVRRPGAAGRSAGTGVRVYGRSVRRWRLVCGTGRGPAPPGSGRAVTRSWPAAASWRIRFRPRIPARLHSPPRVFRAGPHLLCRRTPATGSGKNSVGGDHLGDSAMYRASPTSLSRAGLYLSTCPYAVCTARTHRARRRPSPN